MIPQLRQKKGPLRVCHLISGDLWAGAEVMSWNLLRKLHERSDLEISIILMNEGRLAEELRTLGLPVQVIDERNVPFHKLLLATRAFLREKSPQVIHSHRYKENILAFLGRSSGVNSRLVATEHGVPESNYGDFRMEGRIITRLDRILLARQFDRLVTVSYEIRDRFIGQYGFSSTKVSVIHNGIELPGEITPARFGSSIVAGSAGRLFPVKDYLLMVEIARVVAARKAPLRFELAGEGPERGRLEERLAESGLRESFRLCGQVEDMAGFYSGLDFYLNTSINEGIPMTILEAMAHGMPVVAPKVGGISEIIEDGVEGFLVPTRDPNAFAEKCLSLQNAELRVQMGRAARAKVESCFSDDLMARQYYQLYRELAG